VRRESNPADTSPEQGVSLEGRRAVMRQQEPAVPCVMPAWYWRLRPASRRAGAAHIKPRTVRSITDIYADSHALEPSGSGAEGPPGAQQEENGTPSGRALHPATRPASAGHMKSRAVPSIEDRPDRRALRPSGSAAEGPSQTWQGKATGSSRRNAPVRMKPRGFRSLKDIYADSDVLKHTDSNAAGPSGVLPDSVTLSCSRPESQALSRTGARSECMQGAAGSVMPASCTDPESGALHEKALGSRSTDPAVPCMRCNQQASLAESACAGLNHSEQESNPRTACGCLPPERSAWWVDPETGVQERGDSAHAAGDVNNMLGDGGMEAGVGRLRKTTQVRPHPAG
jgi:hypothetical protein